MSSSGEAFAAFRQRFYSEDCELGGRRSEKLNQLLNTTENLVSISSSEDEVDAITAADDEAGTKVHLRYRLIPAPNGWLIKCVHLECPVCRGGTGNLTCTIVAETGGAIS
jgi:hypothetical protein